MPLAVARPARVSLLRAVAFIALCTGASGSLEGQSGRLVGTVLSAAGEPLAAAEVVVTTRALRVLSASSGAFVIANVPAGTYDLQVNRIGYLTTTVAGVVVRSGEDTRVTVRLEPTALSLDDIVVSVSRRAENITDAPAAVTRFGPRTVGSSLGSPVTRLLMLAPGIDLNQVGVTSSFLNGRGFNRVFNSRWLTMEDGRIAAFPETGLPIGEHTTIPKIDLADLEVIAGPGSALYGANASGGVMSASTKDPRRYPGLALEITGGSHRFRDLQARFAGSSGRWGYKIAGQHQAARDWRDRVSYSGITPGGPSLPEVPRDVDTYVSRVSGSVRYYLNDADAYLALNAGASVRDGLGQGAQGRYQISGYRYDDVQLLFRSPRWLAQGYATHSNSGDTYRLNTMTQTQARFPTLSADSARAIASFPVDGRIQAVEVQNNETVGALVRTGWSAIDDSRVTWGLQARRDRVDSYGRLYSDAVTGEAVHLDLRAFYMQVESRLATPLRLVGASRYDTHSRFPSRWSHKIGLLFELAPERVLRVTYNGAYLAPSILQLDLFSVNAAAGTAGLGNSDGFDIRDASGTLVSSVSRMRPETNETWEVGFKGVLGRFYLDATFYRARFRDFMALVGPLANPFAATPTFAFNHRTGQRVEDSAGNPLQLFSYINVGEGRFAGLDASLRYYVGNRISLSSATSLSHVIGIDTRPTDPPEASAFNTSAHRSSLAIEYADVTRNLELSLRTRYVEGYAFRSGPDWGRIPTFATLGVSASYRLAALDATLLLQVDNLASCVGGTTTPPATGINATAQATYTPGPSCGFGIRHAELLNMPSIGTMLFLGVRREWQ